MLESRTLFTDRGLPHRDGWLLTYMDNYLTQMENRLTQMEDHINQGLQGMEERIRQDVIYFKYKSIIRSVNSIIVRTTIEIYRMNQCQWGEPYDMLPRTRQDIVTPTNRQIHILPDAYNMHIRSALSLDEKKKLFCLLC